MVIAWARRRGAGAFRPAPEEYISLAGSVGSGEEAHYRENEALARLLARYWPGASPATRSGARRA